MKRIFLTLAASLALGAPAAALADDAPPQWDTLDGVAQDDDDDEGDALDDILNEEKSETVAEERDAVQSGDLDDRVGVQSESLLVPEDARNQRRVIKTLQRKNFLKLGRYELSPHVGFVTNDPFINRYMVGTAFAYHLTEVVAVEGMGSFSPNFGQGDWKPITEQLVTNNKVSPDISKIVYFGNLNLQYSPIYGKIAVVGRNIINFDIFGSFGAGFVHTEDDLKALQAEGEPRAEKTASQNHISTNIGGGFRIIFSKAVAARLEGRSLIFVETINSTTLEMKNNFMLLGSVSFFFPGMD